MNFGFGNTIEFDRTFVIRKSAYGLVSRRGVILK